MSLVYYAFLSFNVKLTSFRLRFGTTSHLPYDVAAH